MIRVTSGIAKNRKLKIPEVPGIRVVQDKAKQALFSILGDKVKEAKCLDLYSGSGSLGIEALSRGAKWCDFVDENYDSKGTILENLQKCGFDENFDVIKDDAVKYAANTREKYDLIFLDPFYDNLSHKFLVKNLEEILNPNGLVAFFHGKELDIDTLIKGTNLKIQTQRGFGASYLTLLTD